MAEDYNDLHHVRNDARDANHSATAAKLLATLALITAAIALAMSIAAWNKANDAFGNSQRAENRVEQVQQQ